MGLGLKFHLLTYRPLETVIIFKNNFYCNINIKNEYRFSNNTYRFGLPVHVYDVSSNIYEKIRYETGAI